MERYNYTEAGMVPADGGDWVKAEDLRRNSGMTTVEMRLEFPSGPPNYREATMLMEIAQDMGGGTSIDDCDVDALRLSLRRQADQLADFLAKHQKERKA